MVIRIGTIAVLGTFLAFVWGTPIRLVDGGWHQDIGIIFFCSDAWKNLPSGNNAAYFVIANILGILGLVFAVVMTCLFGIKALIKAIKGVKEEGYDKNAVKTVLLITLCYYAYVCVVKLMFGMYTSNLGWGAGIITTIVGIYFTILLGYYCFRSFDKKNVLGFVGKILTALFVMGMFSLFTGVCGNVAAIGGDGLGPWMSFTFSAEYEAGFAAVLSIIVLLIDVFMCLVCAKVLTDGVKDITEEKPLSKKGMLPSIVLLGASVVVMIFGIIISAVLANKFSTDFSMAAETIGLFFALTVILGFNIAISIFMKKIEENGKAAPAVEAATEEAAPAEEKAEEAVVTEETTEEKAEEPAATEEAAPAEEKAE